MFAHSTQSQAASLRLAVLLLFQSDSDGLRGCLAGSVVLNVQGQCSHNGRRRQKKCFSNLSMLQPLHFFSYYISIERLIALIETKTTHLIKDLDWLCFYLYYPSCGKKTPQWYENEQMQTNRNII